MSMRIKRFGIYLLLSLIFVIGMSAQVVLDSWGQRDREGRNIDVGFQNHKRIIVPLHWVGNVPQKMNKPVSLGIPFGKGEIYSEDILQLTSTDNEKIPIDTWPLAYWPDGSIKWSGIAGVIPAGMENMVVEKIRKEDKLGSEEKPDMAFVTVQETTENIRIETGLISVYISRKGQYLVDSLLYKNVKVGENLRLICTTQSCPKLENISLISFVDYQGELKSAEVERVGYVHTVIKLKGVHKGKTGREWLPFVVRLYFYAGSEQVKMVHSFIYDGDQNRDFISALGIRWSVPMREALYNRHVAFSCADGGVWSEAVQPLADHRVLNNNPSLQIQQLEGKRIPDSQQCDERSRILLDHWASWNSYRLSQLTPDAFSIRKRANDDNPWIGTFSGSRSEGYAFVGDITGGLGICLHDFWQSYPSTIEISDTKSETAVLTAWLWSPETEPMDLRHYDNVSHTLSASYEDVQEGMSTPYGISRTSTLTFIPQTGYSGRKNFANCAKELTGMGVLLPTPEYLHKQKAFGIWSLPDRSTAFRTCVEEYLDAYIDFYKKAIEQNKWYGFWNYGDVMHSYDYNRHTWRYDVGGFAWDNTELASNMWLWYNFLRTGRADIWCMAEAMTRHTSEVDVYHIGPNAGLGSRHNVSHWGCGAKEARISQAAWNRFFYYLTTDERCGDLMTEVRDADQKLYTLDPMRLAQPRSKYPCTAPARIRIGPDWLAYAGNWMTEWERTGNLKYRDKILAGMKSILLLPNRISTGPAALGYDPATGVITSECDQNLLNTNHLMTIMGGFEIMNEIMDMVDFSQWNNAWLEYAQMVKDDRYRTRLKAYAAFQTHDAAMKKKLWNDLFARVGGSKCSLKVKTLLPPVVPAPLDESDGLNTNDVSLWSLDAIYMQEVIPYVW